MEITEEEFNLSGEFIEPMLRDDPGRFVLFPLNTKRFGTSINNMKQHFGLLKKSI